MDFGGGVKIGRGAPVLPDSGTITLQGCRQIGVRSNYHIKIKTYDTASRSRGAAWCSLLAVTNHHKIALKYAVQPRARGCNQTGANTTKCAGYNPT